MSHRKESKQRVAEASFAQEYRELMFKIGMEPLPPIAPEQMPDFVKNDLGRWAQAVKTSGAKPD